MYTYIYIYVYKERERERYIHTHIIIIVVITNINWSRVLEAVALGVPEGHAAARPAEEHGSEQ